MNGQAKLCTDCKDPCAVLFLYTETALHPGSGTSSGIADLLIQRDDKGYPIVQPSEVKGAFRSLLCEYFGVTPLKRELRDLEDEKKQESDKLKKDIREKSKPIVALFGPEADGASEHGGVLSFTEARVLLFPVRSLKGVFAWITSPQVLAEFQRQMRLAGVPPDWKLNEIHLQKNQALVSEASSIKLDGDQLVLEEYTYSVKTDKLVDQIAQWLEENSLPCSMEDPEAYAWWRSKLYRRKKNGSPAKEDRSNLVILPDEDFLAFTKESTEIITRIRISPETGTVAHGALWTEEHLPQDTLLYTVVLALDAPRGKTSEVPNEVKENDKPSQKKALDYFKGLVQKHGLLQMGGGATVGRGFVRVRVYDGRPQVKGGEANACAS